MGHFVRLETAGANWQRSDFVVRRVKRHEGKHRFLS